MVTSSDEDYLVPNSEFLRTVIERTVVNPSVQMHAQQCSIPFASNGLPGIKLEEDFMCLGPRGFNTGAQYWMTSRFTSATTESRFILVNLKTLTGISGMSDISDLPTSSSHAWGMVIDTERNLVYVYDSRYKRDVAQVIKVVCGMLYSTRNFDVDSRFKCDGVDKALLSLIIRYLRSARTVDFTFNALQIGGTCSRWSQLFVDKIASGEYDETLDTGRMMEDRLALDAEVMSL